MSNDTTSSVEQTETTTNQLAELEQKLVECQTQKDDFKDKFMRATADFANFKQRTEKEKALWIKTGQSALLTELLAVVDNFDRALTAQAPSDEVKAFVDGFGMINQELYKLLEKFGVKEIDQITTFDPELHEALVQIDAPDHESGAIVEVMQKGFELNGQVLRPAKVTVAK